jgi:membrane fusion protein (multidrug efflux system)
MAASSETEIKEIEASEVTPPDAGNLPALPSAQPPRARRRGGRLLLMLAVPVALIAGGTWFWLTGGRFQETENASLRQARITIAADASGRVMDVRVHDNEQVSAGDTLFVVDPEPYRIALSQADASLATARLNVEQMRSAYNQAIAKQGVASEEVDYLKTELNRQSSLTKKGVGTETALESARRDLAKAEQELQAARDSVAGTLAALGGDAAIETDKHPAVLAALAARDKAAWQLGQTTVRAPASGVISQASSFKAGQFVTAGTALFSLVETGDVWVEANFKETQLTNMQPGQSAEVTLDTFPDHPLTAVVDSIGAGTGAEFSLLPAQNATGNWVKVTQRIPVRLKIENGDAAMLLRTGMSATVSVDTKVSRSLAGLFGTAVAAPAAQK